MRGKCIAPGCSRDEHAKGYCRKHYAQIWRTGKICDPKAKYLMRPRVDPEVNGVLAARNNCQRELMRARDAYEVAGNLECRRRWRAEIVKLETELAELRERVRGAGDGTGIDAGRKERGAAVVGA